MKDKLVAMLDALDKKNQLASISHLAGIVDEIQNLGDVDKDTYPLVPVEELSSLTQKQANQLIALALLAASDLVPKL